MPQSSHRCQQAAWYHIRRTKWWSAGVPFPVVLRPRARAAGATAAVEVATGEAGRGQQSEKACGLLATAEGGSVALRGTTPEERAMAAIEKDKGAEEQRELESPAEPQEQRTEDARLDVKSEVARQVIAAMEKGETPWQKPWSSQAMRPRNLVTGNAYRGINRVLLSLAGGNGLWVTYQQAKAQGWQVRKGEKGTMIAKVVELGDVKAKSEQASSKDKDAKPEPARRNVILKRYYVFGSHQIEGMPELEPPGERDFDPIAKAESTVEAMQERTGLRVFYGKDEACYVPAMDAVHLSAKKSFRSPCDLAATQMHELGHSTLSETWLARRDAVGKRWGDEAYAVEELRAELCSAILSAELGIEMTPQQREKHLANHAAYLQSWIKALRSDSMAIFTAARDAEKMAEYILGVERQHTAMKEHDEWVAHYDRAPTK
jgi:antirestriction protein ArdC